MMSIKLPQIVFQPKNEANFTKILAYQTSNSGCFDIYCDEEKYVELLPGMHYCFKTGIKFDHNKLNPIYIPVQNDYPVNINTLWTAVLVLRPRSGLAARSAIHILAGEIDLDYTDEINAILINLGKQPVIFMPGERICQARWTLCLKAPGVETLFEKRIGGLGSTGK